MLADGITYIDLAFQRRPRVIATGSVWGAGQLALVDPGPASCLERLEDGLQAHGFHLQDITHLLLTHIHLDHAGASGSIVTRVPGIRVLVHERGARHLADPTRLLDSAARLYGADMDRLWGEVLPVPHGNLVPLAGGERFDVGGRSFEVAYTPGHASHHVSYFEASSRIAFVGDTAGVCVGDYILPPTPPPDIDIEAWKGSVNRIEAWRPDTLFLTHYGPRPSPSAHLRTLMDNLDRFSGFARALLNDFGSDEEQQERFVARVRHELRRHMNEEQMAAYAIAAPFEQPWLGLARYWRKAGS